MAPVLVSDPIIVELLEGLERDDVAVTEADLALRQARARFEVASHKYAVLRDIVTRRLNGRSPYYYLATQGLGVQSFDAQPRHIDLPSGGRFRFLHMQISEAAVEVLKESDEPLILEEIQARLQKGGMPPYETAPRSLNGALINRKGVNKNDEGAYYFDPVEGAIPF